MEENFEKDINDTLEVEELTSPEGGEEENAPAEEYVKIEVDSVTEETEDGEIIELLDTEEKPKKSVFKEILDWVYSIAVALAVVLVLHIFVFIMVNVSGSSMYPTLVDGDRLVASRLYFEPEREDIVVVQPYLSEGTVKGKLMFGRTLYIKRIIATEGQTIDIKNAKVYIDGIEIDEEYIKDSVRTLAGSTTLPVTIPEDHVFVMGDNREHSLDSRDRSVGIIRNEQIVGKAVFRLTPLSSFGVIK